MYILDIKWSQQQNLSEANEARWKQPNLYSNIWWILVTGQSQGYNIINYGTN